MAQRSASEVPWQTGLDDGLIADIATGAGDWQRPWRRSGKGANRAVGIDTTKAFRGKRPMACAS